MPLPLSERSSDRTLAGLGSRLKVFLAVLSYRVAVLAAVGNTARDTKKGRGANAPAQLPSGPPQSSGGVPEGLHVGG